MLMLMDCWIDSGEKSVCGRRSRMRGCERREPAQALNCNLEAFSIRVANLAGVMGEAGKRICSECCGEEIMDDDVEGKEGDKVREGDTRESDGGNTERRGDANEGSEA